LIVRTVILVLNCMMVAVTETLRLSPGDASHRPGLEAPFKERLCMVLADFRNAFRLLVRERGFTAAAVLTLALGVGANVAVFAVVEATLLRPLPYPEADRLVIMNHRDKQTGITKEFIAIGDFVDLGERQSSFESFAAYDGGHVTISGMGDPFRARALLAGPGLLETVGGEAVMGRGLQVEDSRDGAAPVLMIGYELWKNRFGSDPNIIGRGITVDGIKGQIVGVVKRPFRFPLSNPTEVILPMSIPVQAPSARKSNWTFALARLKSGVSLEQASAELSSISERLAEEYPSSNQSSEYFGLSLRDAVVGKTRPALML